MQQHDKTRRHYTYFSILLVAILVVLTGCDNLPNLPIAPKPGSTQNPVQVNSSTPVGPSKAPASRFHIDNAYPTVTPLVCPGDQSGSVNSYVTRQDNQLMYNGSPIKFSGFTFYPSLEGGSSAWSKPTFTHYIDYILGLAVQAGQNLVRPTDFWDKSYTDVRQTDITVWQNLDYLVCAAKQKHIFVEMDISAFGWFLLSQSQVEFNAVNWKAFLDAVAARYSSQPTVAFYSVVGEPAAPQNVQQMNDLVNFYDQTTTELHTADPHHLIMAGALIHMEAETAALPWWHKVFALPHSDIIGFKTYSDHDLALIPEIAAYANQLAKPMIDEEFGMPQNQGDAVASGQTYNGLQVSRSQFFESVYSAGQANGVSGFIFWNMGCEMADTSYEVSPSTPAVWKVVEKYAPNPTVTTGTLLACPFPG